MGVSMATLLRGGHYEGGQVTRHCSRSSSGRSLVELVSHRPWQREAATVSRRALVRPPSSNAMTSIRLSVTDEERAAYSTNPYFGVGILKLAVLSLCSFGIYDLFWCYRQWNQERDRTGETLSPLWRAVFAPLWAFSLFERIHRRAMSNRLPADWSPNALAIAFLALNVTWRLPDPYWLVSLLTFLPIIPVQRTINTLNTKAAPETDRNDRFSGPNLALLLLGGALLALAIYGTFVPVDPYTPAPAEVGRPESRV
jgi:hypothetical protein